MADSISNVQDFLQWSSLSRIVFDQLVTEPGTILNMTFFMRSPQAGQMFASNFAMLFLYDLLFRLTRLGAPFHEAILPPVLLYKWRRLVSFDPYTVKSSLKRCCPQCNSPFSGPRSTFACIFIPFNSQLASDLFLKTNQDAQRSFKCTVLSF